jgi:hypothetical protein
VRWWNASARRRRAGTKDSPYPSTAHSTTVIILNLPAYYLPARRAERLEAELQEAAAGQAAALKQNGFLKVGETRFVFGVSVFPCFRAFSSVFERFRVFSSSGAHHPLTAGCVWVVVCKTRTRQDLNHSLLRDAEQWKQQVATAKQEQAEAEKQAQARVAELEEQVRIIVVECVCGQVLS